MRRLSDGNNCGEDFRLSGFFMLSPVSQFKYCPKLVLRGENGDTIHDYLPSLRSHIGRDDADRRLPILLRLQGMRHPAQAQSWRLLRILLLWLSAVSAGPAERSAANEGRLGACSPVH